jgi:uncharacterized protein (DUF983 family)
MVMNQVSVGRMEERSVQNAMLRGAMCRCPNCGEGRLFRRYLKVVDRCGKCGEELFHERAHDAPPYVVMSIVGHIVVGGILSVEVAWHPEVWVHLVIWLPLTIILSLALLQPVKGALIGMQWALRMHGFGGEEEHVPALPAGHRPAA